MRLRHDIYAKGPGGGTLIIAHVGDENRVNQLRREWSVDPQMLEWLCEGPSHIRVGDDPWREWPATIGVWLGREQRRT